MPAFTQDNLERAHAIAAARARAHANARAASCKKEKQAEEDGSEEDGKEIDDGKKGIITSQAQEEARSWLRRAMSDVQQDVLTGAVRQELTLPGQNLPTPLIVRNTFIEAPIALPLVSRFSKLRRAASCPAGGQHGAADSCSALALEESEDEVAVVAAGAVPQSSEACWEPQMQPWELSALSVGSLKHGSKRCKPCAFVHTDAGCANGTACIFCHACSPGEKRRRQKVKTQHRKRRLLQQRLSAEGKEVTAQVQLAIGALHTETHQPFTEYQPHVSMQAEESSCL